MLEKVSVLSVENRDSQCPAQCPALSLYHRSKLQVKQATIIGFSSERERKVILLSVPRVTVIILNMIFNEVLTGSIGSVT